MPRRFGILSFLTLAAAGVALFAGCDNSPKPAPELTTPDPGRGVKTPDSQPDVEHAHKSGGHGGNIVAIGRDNYHAEAVFEKGGTLKLYTLGQDEAKVQEVESQVLTAYAKLEGGTESASFILRPVPQPGDGEGKTSLFVGKVPPDLVGQSLEVVIPSITIAGERFRLGFTSAASSHEEGVPAKVADEEEKKLYLTPGGKYTEADIASNGHQTASEKFQGMKAAHDLRPKRGEAICPVTLTKANPKFTWVIDGKTYQFCCPPCVDEFVQTAKEHPEAIKDPQEYVKP
jgi:YHS domain-containing protein